MNLSQGLYRVAQAIKWTGRVLGGLCFFGVVVSFSTSTNQSDLKAQTLIFLCLSLVFVGVTAGVAWVLEGFAND